jgi:hypothetical protein
MNIPLPNTRLGESTVIASTVYYDDGERPNEYTVLLLGPTPPYFTVAILAELSTDSDGTSGQDRKSYTDDQDRESYAILKWLMIDSTEPMANIVTAVDEYQQWGGDA